MDKGLDTKKKEVAARGPDLKLFVRDVRDRQGRKRPITVRSWSTIQDIKHTIQQAIHIPPTSQRLYFGPLLTSGRELPNHRTLHDAGIYKSGETLLLDIKANGVNYHSDESSSSLFSSLDASFNSASRQQHRGEASKDISISSSVIDSTPRVLKQIVQQARRGLALGLKPETALDGSGGTYFFHDVRKVKIGVFKPADEEPYAENNPRGYLKQAGQDNMALREGIIPGEACIREVAAFMLDHGGFSGVPMTTLVEASHPSFNNNGARLKVSEGGASIGAHSINSNSQSQAVTQKVGSFQEFVKAECTMDDLSPSKISVDEVHKIAVLDIRLMNADRNSANLLCRRRRDDSIELVPIDHGFSLRSVADTSWMDWCWLDWPQLKEPMSQATKDYINKLDIDHDARILEERLNVCREALDYFRASTSILKAGTQAGLSLYEIACMCCRNDNLGEVPSSLEILYKMAAELADKAVREGRHHHSAASRALEDQLSPHGGSLISTSSHGFGAGMKKAISMVQFTDYTGTEQAQPDRIIPGMIRSTASDSSSDTIEDAPDEYDEWAATVIADVSLEQQASLRHLQKERSPSVESDSSDELSSSPTGFWHVRPGSNVADSDIDSSDDEDSITWSPSTSPNENFLDLSVSSFERASRRPSFNPSGLGHRASVILTGETQPTDFAKIAPKTPTKVKFAVSPQREFPPSPIQPTGKAGDSSPNHAYKRSFSTHSADSVLGERSLPKKPAGGFQRSLSYSALSERMVDFEEEKSKTLDMGMKRPSFEENELYRDYFLKFVDLVIVRETTAASRQNEIQARE